VDAEARAARLPAVAQVIAAATLFGTVGTARALGPDAPAAAVGAARALLAALLLVPLAALAGQSWRAALRRRPVWVAGAAQAGFNVCFLSAVLLTGVATGTLLAIGSAPLFAGLLHRRVDRRWLLVTLVGVCGLVLLALGGGSARLEPRGVALALGAGLSYAVYALATARAVVGGLRPGGLGMVGPAAVTAGTFVVAAALLAPALALSDTGWLGTGSGLAMAGWLALGPTVASYLLLSRGLRALTPPVVTTLGLTEPVVATVLAVLVLGERPSAAGWAGAALVLASLLGTAVAEGRRPRARPRLPAAKVRGSAT
jgi:DME family drug/metabolite transporter